MKYPVFASILLFGLWFLFNTKRLGKAEKNIRENYWERERLANASRRKPLEGLAYIQIPFDALPMDVLAGCPEIQEFQARLQELSQKKIVNFTGYSNTDLKLAYGAPNINLLSEYDQNFTDLITLLQSWGAFLLYGKASLAQDDPFILPTDAAENPMKQADEKDRLQAAKTVLEYAVFIGSDISATYEMLKKIYLEADEAEKINVLKEKAETLRSLSKGKILAMLEESEN